MSAFLRGLRELFFPPKCAVCRSLLDAADLQSGRSALCPVCTEQWERACTDPCEICGKQLSLCACMTRAMAEDKCAEMRVLVFYRHGRRDAVQNRLLFHIKEQREDAAPHFLSLRLAPLVEALLG